MTITPLPQPVPATPATPAGARTGGTAVGRGTATTDGQAFADLVAGLLGEAASTTGPKGQAVLLEEQQSEEQEGPEQEAPEPPVDLGLLTMVLPTQHVAAAPAAPRLLSVDAPSDPTSAHTADSTTGAPTSGEPALAPLALPLGGDPDQPVEQPVEQPVDQPVDQPVVRLGASDDPAPRRAAEVEASPDPTGARADGAHAPESPTPPAVASVMAPAGQTASTTTTAFAPDVASVTAGAPTAPAAPPAEPAPAQQGPGVTRQVAAEVLRLAESGPRHDSTRHVTLQLNPAALGEVRVTLSLRAGTVRVRLAAGSDVAREALADGLPELRRLLVGQVGGGVGALAGRPESAAVGITIADLSTGTSPTNDVATSSDQRTPGHDGHAGSSGSSGSGSAHQRPARTPLGHTATDGSRRPAPLPSADDQPTSHPLGRVDVSV